MLPCFSNIRHWCSSTLALRRRVVSKAASLIDIKQSPEPSLIASAFDSANHEAAAQIVTRWVRDKKNNSVSFIHGQTSIGLSTYQSSHVPALEEVPMTSATTLNQAYVELKQRVLKYTGRTRTNKNQYPSLQPPHSTARLTGRPENRKGEKICSTIPLSSINPMVRQLKQHATLTRLMSRRRISQPPSPPGFPKGDAESPLRRSRKWSQHRNCFSLFWCVARKDIWSHRKHFTKEYSCTY